MSKDRFVPVITLCQGPKRGQIAQYDFVRYVVNI